MPDQSEQLTHAEGFADLPLTIRRELAVIASSQGVALGSVKYQADATGGRCKVSFVLGNETPVETRKADILPEEPIEFLYSGSEAFGVEAPVILSGRNSFPRNLGHLNPVPEDSPANLCLARAGLQDIYDRHGVEGVLARLRAWMRDAITGALMADGWEPVPSPSETLTRAGAMYAASFQELAVSKPSSENWTTGAARIVLTGGANYVVVETPEISATLPKSNSALAKLTKMAAEGEGRTHVPWIFLWPADRTPIADPFFGVWPTYKHLRDALKKIGLLGPLEAAIGQVLVNGCDCKHAPGAKKTLVVLVGIWRPLPIMGNIFGLSNDPTARSLEIRALTLETTSTKSIVDDETSVRTIVSDALPEPSLYQWTTGTPDLGAVGLIGNGALGSAIADHLLRSGLKAINVFDKDVLGPHNLARHSGVLEDIYQPKVNQIKRQAQAIAVKGMGAAVNDVPLDVTALSDADLAKRLGLSRLIIDATADERVRGRLTKFKDPSNRSIARVEAYDHGRLGVQFVTASTGNPNLFDLYYLLCLSAIDREAVASWLASERLEGPSSEMLTFGFGCSSRTNRLPNYVVGQHASSFMPTIIRGLSGDLTPGIGLNSLDKENRPRGWAWLPVPELKQAEPSTAPGWIVRIHPDVCGFMNAQRAGSLPRETGGYLYGGCDIALKQMTIVAASPLPPGSVASESNLKLGPAGKTAVEKKLSRRTYGRLQLCGSWHSHPGASADLSATDRATMEEFRKIDFPRGIPTLFVVVAESTVAVHLEA